MAHQIFTNATLQLISKKIPRSKKELLEINGISNVKLTKYGDRVLETIEATINEYHKTEENCTIVDYAKRRGMVNMENTGRSKKNAVKWVYKPAGVMAYDEAAQYPKSINDIFDYFLDAKSNVSHSCKIQINSGEQVAPSWSAAAASKLLRS